MSSKTKERLHLAIATKNAAAKENQRLKRALAAILHDQGEVKIPYTSAAMVKDTDEILVDFNKATGVYTVRLVERENADNLVDGSGEVELQDGEGDVGGSVPSGEPDQTGEAVEVRDKYHPE